MKLKADRIAVHASVVACIVFIGWFAHSLWAYGPETTSATNRSVADYSLASLDLLGAKIAFGHDLRALCGARLFGSGFGHHTLCSRPIPVPKCYFYSFGISTDYSFDIDVANSTGCVGFAADPTITHPSKLHPNVFFTQMAANAYDAADTAQFPLRTSVPALRLLLGHDHIAILKMDCEGCEYALARDALTDDPDFFRHVDQFAVEVHYSRMFLKTKLHLHSFAALLEMLEDAGLVLIEFEVSGCGPAARATGVIPELLTTQLYQSVGTDRHCHNYLFARLS